MATLSFAMILLQDMGNAALCASSWLTDDAHATTIFNKGAPAVTELPLSMRQIIFDGAGGPDVIRMTDVPLPELKAGQVLIEVVAAGINRPDCLQRAGGYPPPPGATAIPGLEVAGRVVKVADDVLQPSLGDEVCALVISGGYAEFCVADAALCLPVPAPLDLVSAACLPETFFTVYDNVFTRGRLAKGETLLVHGGSSGIGSTAIQLAASAGAKVLATAGSDEKCAFCVKLGAEAAINYRTSDFVEQVKRLTDKRGVDVVLDMVGGDYLQKNVSCLALEGRLVQIAFLKASKTEFDFMPMMMKRLTLCGSTLRARTVAQKTKIANALVRDVWPLLEEGKVKPVIHARFGLEQTRQAHELMESSAHLGKIVIVTGR